MFDLKEAVLEMNEQERRLGIDEQNLSFLCYSQDNNKFLLFIHGSGSSPCSIKALSELLFARGVNVFAPLLPGHGLDEEELNNTHWQECTKRVEDCYHLLRRVSDEVFVAGYSLGGGLVSYLAGKEKVAGLISICGLTPPDMEALTSLPFPDNGWNRTLGEFAQKLLKVLPKLNVPKLIFHASNDDVLPFDFATYFFGLENDYDKQLIAFGDGGHSLPITAEMHTLCEWMARFIFKDRRKREIVFRYHNANAKRVDLSGVFTRWHPVEMQRNGEEFVLAQRLYPGEYQYGFVVDGQGWETDPDKPTTCSPKGRNSLLIVE